MIKSLILYVILLFSVFANTVYAADPENIMVIEVEGEAGGNLVKVILSGDYELKSIIISDTAKKESQEIINDLIIKGLDKNKLT